MYRPLITALIKDLQVEYRLREAGVASSNLVTPTKFPKGGDWPETRYLYGLCGLIQKGFVTIWMHSQVEK